MDRKRRDQTWLVMEGCTPEVNWSRAKPPSIAFTQVTEVEEGEVVEGVKDGIPKGHAANFCACAQVGLQQGWSEAFGFAEVGGHASPEELNFLDYPKSRSHSGRFASYPLRHLTLFLLYVTPSGCASSRSQSH